MSKEDVILSKLDSLKGWAKEITTQLKLLNGKVNEHHTDIAILKEWKETVNTFHTKLEMMSRGKFLAILSAIALFVGTVFLYIFRRMIEGMR